MPLFVSNGVAAALTTFAAALHTANNDGVLLNDFNVVTDPVPGIDRVDANKQTQGEDGVKGLVAALLASLVDWTAEKTVVGANGGVPAYQNSFVALTDSGNADSAYYTRHLDGDVVIGGWVTAPASPGTKTIFTLPAGYTPAKRLWYVVPTNTAAPNNTGNVTVEINGNVTVVTMSGNAAFSLDGIRFRSA